MIEFQKEYLQIIEEQKQKALIMQSIFGDYLQPFNDIASFVDGDFVGDTPDATASNMDNAINNVTGKLSYMKPMTDYVKEKGKALTKAFVSPIQMCKKGGNVSQKAQQNGQNAGKFAQRQSYKAVEEECRKKNIKIKGITSESIIAESAPYIKKCAKEHSREVSEFLRHCILEDAKQGITPNMWFDSNANPADQRDIIFENTTISFKTNNGKLICEEIQNKSKKRHLISESTINKNIIIENTQYGNYKMKELGISPDILKDVGLLTKKGTLKINFGKDTEGNSLGIQHWIANPKNARKIRGKISQAKLIELSNAYKANNRESAKLLSNVSQISSTNTNTSNTSNNTSNNTQINPATTTQIADTSAVQNGLPSGQASKIPFADKGKFSQQKGIWAKIKWILKSIYQLIYKVIGFICQLILGLILTLLCLIKPFKLWLLKAYHKQPFDAAKAILNNNPVGRGVIHTFSIGAIVLAVYGIGTAIASLLTDDQKKQEQQLTKLSSDLSIIMDFEV